MKVAENRDGEAFQPRRPAPKGNLPAHDLRPVGLDQSGINGQGGHASGRCKADESPPSRRKKRQIGLGPLHCQIPRHRGRMFSAYPDPAGSRYDETSAPIQKANVACSSMRRFDEVPCENAPPCKALETSKILEPRTEYGLATFTLLKTLRAPTPRVRL